MHPALHRYQQRSERLLCCRRTTIQAIRCWSKVLRFWIPMPLVLGAHPYAIRIPRLPPLWKQAAGLRPPPADLVVHVPLHADHDLFQIIHDGVTGTAMASLSGQMTEEEIWHTMNYLKTLSHED